MQIYQCPNCGRTYSEFQNVYYCGTCNYRLLKQEDITEIKKPELSQREYKVIGTVQPVVTCRYCQSTNVKKISAVTKAGGIALFGILGLGRASKEWHCNNCNSDF